MKILLILFLSTNIFSAIMTEEKLIHDDVERTYLKYIPTGYQKNVPINLVIGLHGYSGSASGFEKETTGMFNLSAEKYNFIGIYPQGDFFYNKSDQNYSFISSWNELSSSKGVGPNREICVSDAVIYPKYPNCKNNNRCSWTSCSDDIGFIKNIIEAIKKNYDIKKVYVLGMSNGGMMAQALACEYPHLFSGVANVVGMQHLGLSCVPNSPVSFILYGGANDVVVPPVKIKSYDGYLYEPIKNTFSNWSDKFGCKYIEVIEINTHNKLSKNLSSGCENNVKVISILNHDSGHHWPGTNSDRGYCHDEIQNNINSPKCKIVTPNQWGNDFLLEILLNL